MHHTVTRDFAVGYSVVVTTLTVLTCCVRSDARGPTAIWTDFYTISTPTEMTNGMGNTKWYFRIFSYTIFQSLEEFRTAKSHLQVLPCLRLFVPNQCIFFMKMLYTRRELLIHTHHTLTTEYFLNTSPPH